MFWITLWGILFHSSNNAWRKVAPVVRLTGRLSTHIPNAYQTCSIGGQLYHSVTSLHFCDRSLIGQRSRDKILAPYVVPMFQAHQDLRIFQQDNARSHTALDFKIQYFVCPPLTVIQATQRRRIERIMFWITLWGILQQGSQWTFCKHRMSTVCTGHHYHRIWHQ
jgi:hypothetical protein